MRPTMKFSRLCALACLIAFFGGCASSPKKGSVKTVATTKAAPSLERALAEYRTIAEKGGWPRVFEGRKLVLGDKGEDVATLRHRLAITGDLSKDNKNDTYDEDLVEGVKRFQIRHGLEPDGAVGKDTAAALNVPVETRIRQIEANISERQKNPMTFENDAVIVNVPDFRLKVLENGKVVDEIKVVLGQARQWQTPLLSSKIQNVIVNPKWSVPSGIFEKELIHHLRKDPDYLEKNRMKVLQAVDGKVQAVDAAQIDWSQVNAKNPGMQVVQAEGSGNSLGRLKFLFPNPYAVYLHDTPQKSFFKRNMRALSHGCVRVERPVDLATHLLKNESWPRDRIERAVGTGKNQSVSLSKPVPVYIIYRTVWIGDDGRVNFRNDVYGRESSFF